MVLPKGYVSSLELKTDLFHNFPKEYDAMILKHGAYANRLQDMRKYGNIGHWLELTGFVNGTPEFYELGINAPVIGDFIQNGFHHLKLPFIIWGIPAMSSGNFKKGSFSVTGFSQYGSYSQDHMY